MPPRYAIRVEDLACNHGLEAICLFCGHHSFLPHQFLRERFPGYLRIIELERLLRCNTCRRKGQAEIIPRLLDG